ncbi:DUF6281 family protein [Streptomyces sp. NPDC006332]|uniref:DUF6281 family protein n=1 Tax=Streptomyces sp. NPDC006332 TaxID=3155456 RepID=UPI0033AE4557
MITALRRAATTGPFVAALLLASACTESSGTAEASCAFLVTYDNRTYAGIANVDFTVGGRLGTATVPSCDDTPNDPADSRPEGRITAYAVREADPSVSIAVGDSPDDVTLMRVNSP